jgi:hypothetical protein
MRSIVRCRRGGVQLSRHAPVFQWADLSLARSVQFNVNSFEHSVQIARYFRVPESDDSVSLPLKPKLPIAVTLSILIIVVMPAVEFDDQTLGGAEEIYHIATDWSLTPEVCAVCRQFFQRTPQDALVRCRIGSQFVRCCSADRRCDHFRGSPHPARCASDPPPPGEGKNSARPQFVPNMNLPSPSR